MFYSDRVIVIDIEATCWENNIPPKGQQMDIIEIGICNLIIESGEIIDKQSIYILPERSEISSFCTNLTGITTNLVNEKGISFSLACKKIIDEYEPFGRVWGSYGEFDRSQLIKQCKDFDINYPLGLTHINIKSLLALKRKFRKGRGMKSALISIGETLEGKHHNGADDAYNTAKILRWILNS